jgi:hypothetical protein
MAEANGSSKMASEKKAEDVPVIHIAKEPEAASKRKRDEEDKKEASYLTGCDYSHMLTFRIVVAGIEYQVMTTPTRRSEYLAKGWKLVRPTQPDEIQVRNWRRHKRMKLEGNAFRMSIPGLPPAGARDLCDGCPHFRRFHTASGCVLPGCWCIEPERCHRFKERAGAPVCIDETSDSGDDSKYRFSPGVASTGSLSSSEESSAEEEEEEEPESDVTEESEKEEEP